MEPSGECELENVRATVAAGRVDQVSQTTDWCPTMGIGHGDLDAEGSKAKMFLAGFGEPGQRGVERDLSGDESVDRFTGSIMLAEDELSLAVDLFDEDVVGLWRSEDTEAGRKGRVPARCPEDLSLRCLRDTDDQVIHLTLMGQPLRDGRLGQLHRPAFCPWQHESNDAPPSLRVLQRRENMSQRALRRMGVPNVSTGQRRRLPDGEPSISSEHPDAPA